MRRFFRKPPQKSQDLVNQFIPFESFMVIDENNKNLGVLTKEQALVIAHERGLDLFCINSNSSKPICKILNYDNYRFNQQKALKKNKNIQNELEEKEIRISASIGDNDLKFKVAQCQKFLQKKHQVKITMRLRGREKYVPNYGLDKINQFVDLVKNSANFLKSPQLKNNAYTIILESKR